MRNTFNPIWSQLSQVPTEEVIDRVLTGVGALENFKPDYELIKWAVKSVLETSTSTDFMRVLDFGAGPLRNTLGLLYYSMDIHVTAYDNVDMLKRGLEIFEPQLELMQQRIRLVSSWEIVREEHYDLTIASLVFQHIEPEYLRTYLKELKTNELVVSGRRSFDDLRTPAWPVILEYYDIVEVKEPGTIEQIMHGEWNDHHTVRLKPK